MKKDQKGIKDEKTAKFIKKEDSKTSSEVDSLKDEIDKLTEALQRTQADFINYKKRLEKEQDSFTEYANESLLLEILPVFDHLNLALKHLPDDLKENDWSMGIENIKKQFEDVLNKLGIVSIRTIAEKYNPELHEAVLQGPGEKDIILEELEAGYMLKEKVLRPAKVKVGNGDSSKL